MSIETPVMCDRCARIYFYNDQPEARCPRCGWNRWIDHQMLISSIETMIQEMPVCLRQLLDLLKRGSKYVTVENREGGGGEDEP